MPVIFGELPDSAHSGVKAECGFGSRTVWIFIYAK